MRFKIIKENLSSPYLGGIDDLYSIKSKNKKIDERVKVANEVLKSFFERKYADLQPIIPSLASSIVEKGSDISNNKFLELISKFPYNTVIGENADKFEYINDIYLNNTLDLNLEDMKTKGKNISSIFLQPTLYYDTFENFRYIVNAFALLSNPSYVEKNFKDPSVVDLSLFFDERGLSKSKDEIESIINGWYNGNEGEPSSPRRKKYSLWDVLKSRVENYRNKDEQIDYLNRLWEDYKYLISNDAESNHVKYWFEDKDRIASLIDYMRDTVAFSDVDNDKQIASDLFTYIIEEIWANVFNS